MSVMRKLAVLGCIGVLLGSGAVEAASYDEAPVPRRSPRTAVSQQTIVKPALPPSRTVSGTATIIDTERLRIEEIDMRLFGVVPPQLSASFGPQARAVLDSLTAGVTVTCLIRDRDRDGRFLASCRGANNTDLAQELLRRGLAVTARGSLHGTDFESAYVTAEQTAQAQKLGLWMGPSAPAAAAAPAAAPAPVAAPPVAKVEVKAPEPKPEAKVEPKPEEKPEQATKAEAPAKDSPKSEKTTRAEEIPVPAPAFVEAAPVVTASAPTAVERYQVLILGAFMLLTAAIAGGAVLTRRWMDRREERSSIAAAVRGELMAARAVCLGRLRAISSDDDDRNTSWPRVRTMVFQAYVGRIGLLGGELARQVASIYGQASDYAAYYNTAFTDENVEPVSKRHALQTLTQHIEEVLPRLAGVEAGLAVRAAVKLKPQAPSRTMLASSRHVPVAALAAPEPVVVEPEVVEPAVPEDAKVDVVQEKAEAAQTTDEAVKPEVPKSETSPTTEEKVEPPAAKAEETTPEQKAETTTEKKEEAKPSVASNESSSLLWGKIKRLAGNHGGNASKSNGEEQIPDYLNMTEAELEALAYDIELEDEIEVPPAKAQGKK